MQTIQIRDSSVEVTRDADGTLLIRIKDPREVAHVKKAVNRALNTWDNAPKWMFNLSDTLDVLFRGPPK